MGLSVWAYPYGLGPNLPLFAEKVVLLSLWAYPYGRIRMGLSLWACPQPILVRPESSFAIPMGLSVR